MKVSDCMSRAVELASPDDSIQHVARVLRQIDAGVMPVGEDDRLVGMITDRDIVIRGVAAGHGVETKVSAVMTTKIRYCFDDEDVVNSLAAQSEPQPDTDRAGTEHHRRITGICLAEGGRVVGH